MKDTKRSKARSGRRRGRRSSSRRLALPSPSSVDDPARVAYVTQTTLSVDETAEIVATLRRRFPAIEGPDEGDICYATTNRQRAVKELAAEVDLVLVIGSQNSSNSNRLVETARAAGVEAHLIEDETGIDERWLEQARTVGLTSGASAPERLVARVCDWFRGRGVDVRTGATVVEDVFSGCRPRFDCRQPECKDRLVAIVIEPLENGPYLVKNLESLSNSRSELPTKEVLALCRCGHSTNKPFCTGTHRDHRRTVGRGCVARALRAVPRPVQEQTVLRRLHAQSRRGYRDDLDSAKAPS